MNRNDYNDTRCYRSDHELFREVLKARRAAHAKHGDNSIEYVSADDPRWLSILVEEVGEIAHALTYDGPKMNLRAELIDVLAVVSAWIDRINRDEIGPEGKE